MAQEVRKVAVETVIPSKFKYEPIFVFKKWRQMEKKKSIYETQRAIGHPIDLLGNPVNVKQAEKRLDIDLKEIYNYIKEINKYV